MKIEKWESSDRIFLRCRSVMDWYYQIAFHCVDLAACLLIVLQQIRRARTSRAIRDIARQHAPEAIKELARLALEARSECDRLVAIRDLLDCAYSKQIPMKVAVER